MLWPNTPFQSYDRNLYKHWVDADGNQDGIRKEVLIKEIYAEAFKYYR